MLHMVTREGEPWPAAVSSGFGGLDMGCGVCGEEPWVDYVVTDRFWQEAGIDDELSGGVICLPCLYVMGPFRVPLETAIVSVQLLLGKGLPQGDGWLPAVTVGCVPAWSHARVSDG